MNTWKITIEIENGKQEEIELYDAKAYFEGYLKIKRSFFNRLIKAIKIAKNYALKHAIEEVLSPDKEEWILNPWILLIVKDIEKEMPFWFLIKRELDLSGLLVAIGPKSFAEFNNQNFSDAKRDIKRIINFIVSYLNKFNCTIFIPKFLSKL
ncbi:MAG: hypothetical protein KGD73_03495 [Candidatus Lokiarchaeota archaeon]|nr:hypothetical protein [Candidatus Lokiarchaeota archaeon]